MGQRHALVIGSQCNGLPGQRLSFLPDRADDLFRALTDPRRGGCAPEASAKVVDPDLSTMATAVESAVVEASAAGATLVLVFIGHAETLPDPVGGADLYLMPVNGNPQHLTMGSSYLLGQRMRELLAGPAAVGLDGLLLVLDACHAGVGAVNVAQRAMAVAASSDVRIEVLAATFDRTARNGCFSGSLTKLLNGGLPELSSDYIGTQSILNRATAACPQQPPRSFSWAVGRTIESDPGLWLSRNPAAAGRWALAGTTTGGRAVELTRDYRPTDALEQVVGAMVISPVTVLTGGPGSGKSALVAALTRPELSDVIPEHFLDAVADTTLSVTSAEIATTLATQLASFPGFSEASRRYAAGFAEGERVQQSALQSQVVGPILDLDAGPQRRLRIAVDGVDQLDPAVRREVIGAVGMLSQGPAPVGVRFLVTGRTDAAAALVEAFPTAPRLELSPPTSGEMAGVVAALPGALAAFVEANAHSWLDLRLLTDLVTTTADLRADVVATVQDLYRARCAAAVEADPQAGTVMAVLAAAGTGPVLPAAVAAAAAGSMEGPDDLPQLRDVLAALGPLVARAHPGTDAEHVGIFHDTLTSHLHTDFFDEQTLTAAHQAILDALDATAADMASDETLAAASAYRRARRPDHLWAVGDYADAIAAVVNGLGPRPGDNVTALLPWLARATDTLGPDHHDILATRNNIASWTGEAGDPAGAVPLFEALLDDQLRVLGPDHPATLLTRNNIAHWTGQAGDPAGAVPLFAVLLDDQLRVLGPDNPNTLTTRNNIAHWTGQAGDLAGAVPLFEVLLDDQLRVLGPDHPATLLTRNNIAYLTGQAGDPAGAAPLFEALLDDQLRVLGPDHPDTLTTRNNIAFYTGQAGDPAGAAPLFEALLDDQLRVLGPDHPDTLLTRNNLASSTGEAGDPAGAAPLFEALLDDRLRVLGPDHPDTLLTRNNIAYWTGEAGDPASAVPLFEALLDDQLRVLGPDHPGTLLTRNNIAFYTAQAGDPASAVPLFEALLDDQLRVLGPDHPDTLTTRNTIAHLERAAL